MKEEIDWKKELLESKKFNNQFSKNMKKKGQNVKTLILKGIFLFP